jgi:hypothetical protein
MMLGIGILGAIWFFPTIGAAVLGFLLKKNTIVETGPTGPLVGNPTSGKAIGGWGGIIGFAVLGMLAMIVGSLSKHARSSATTTPSAIASGEQAAPDDWSLTESADKMDNSPVVVLRRQGTEGASMIIRCSKHKTEAYVDTNTILNDGNVRVKFDQSSPSRQTWGKSTDDKALFVPDAITFARELTNAKVFLLEFTPFQEGSRTVSFDVTNLGPRLKKISDACDWDAVDRNRAPSKAADAARKARLIQFVHPCENQDIGKWCWSDPNDTLFNHDTGWSDTKEGALQDAMQYARQGLAFKDE